MSPLDVADNKVTERALSAYVPPLQRTEGQPPPIAAHGGLSYMSFDRDGDAATGGGPSIFRRCCAMRGASASTIRASRPAAPNAWTGLACRWRTWNPSAR